MTEEERKRLCADLRGVSTMWGGGSVERVICSKAASEIERLAERVAELEKEIEDIGDEIRRTVGAI